MCPEILFSKKSKYQQIKIIECDPFGRMLYLDDDLQISSSDAEIYSLALLSPLKKKTYPLDRVLILGGGDGGVANQLLKMGTREIVLVDIDEEVIQACQRVMPDVWGCALNSPQVKVVVSDALAYLEENNLFDAVIYDLTGHPESLTGLEQNSFLERICSGIKRRLQPRGVVTMQCCSELDKESIGLVSLVLKEYFHQVQFIKQYIRSYDEKWVFASAQNPSEEKSHNQIWQTIPEYYEKQ